MDFTGTWKNQHGSVLDLRMEGERVEGRFDSAVGEWGSEHHWAEVSGMAQGELITFAARFPAHGSLVSWVGRHIVRDGTSQIETEWLHATGIQDDREHSRMWSANRIGFDVFERA